MTYLAQATIESLPLADSSVDLIFCDPPYPKKFLECYQWLAWEAGRILKPGGFVLVMCGGLHLPTIFSYFEESKLTYYWKYENELTGLQGGQVWRNNMSISIRLKSVLAYSKGRSVARCQTSDKFSGSGNEKKYHQWGQDTLSARYYIDCFSHKGDLVCDPFIGGGTTAVACMALQRRFIGFDIDMDALITSRDRINGKRKENLHELPLFRKLTPELFTRLVLDATNSKTILKTEIVE